MTKLNCKKEECEFTGQGVKNIVTGGMISLKDLSTASMVANNIETQVTVTHSSPV